MEQFKIIIINSADQVNISPISADDAAEKRPNTRDLFSS